MTEVRTSFCRFCTNFCAVEVGIDNGRVTEIRGDRHNSLYEGYTCVKGRGAPEFLNSPDRILRPRKRLADGSFIEITSEQALDEIAAKLSQLRDDYGPRSIGAYVGTLGAFTVTHSIYAMDGLLQAIGSSMMFSTSTIDQPGKVIAQGFLGKWMAPRQGFHKPDVALYFGCNPLISAFGIPNGNLGRWLNRALDGGLQLIVVDPRRTDVAKRAALHLQPRPGHDVPILAAMIHVILDEKLYDQDFVRENVEGLDALRAVVKSFEPSVVADRAGVGVDDLVNAARIFAKARRGFVHAGTGPNMAQSSTLLEYMILVLETVCGRYQRAGETVANPGVTFPSTKARAQACGPYPALDLGEKMRVRDLGVTLAGLPTCAAAEEMLLEGEGQIRGFISCGGNPVNAWPDQLRTAEAFRKLELLVQMDPFMSATAKMAHYVIPPRMSYEMTAVTQLFDLAAVFGVTTEYAYGQYTPAIVDPPEGSDLVQEWEFAYEICRRMGLQLTLPDPFRIMEPAIFDMDHKPDSHDVLAMSCRQARVPLEEMMRHPHGAFFPEPASIVEDKEDGWEGKLDVGSPMMMDDLSALAEPDEDYSEFDFRLISRRMMHVMNSSYNPLALKGKRMFNPAYMNPDDMGRLDIAEGDVVHVVSARARIPAIVEPDASVRPGLISMSHSFGGLPDEDANVARIGSNTGRLIDVTTDFERYSGQARMSNIPVRIVVRPNVSGLSLCDAQEGPVK